MEKYNLSFVEILNNGKAWYVGEDFKKGVFIEVSESGVAQLKEYVESKIFPIDLTLVVSKGLVNQKYKEVLTKNEILNG